MKQKGLSALFIIIILVVLGAAGYLAYKYFIPRINSVLPPEVSPKEVSTIPEAPVVIEPKANARVSSPLKINGTVPPGWMFEGVFPIKLLDENRKLIVEGQATEEVPGSWQSNVPVYFSATLTFSTVSKTGFIILSNDNPSGDPSKAQSFEVPVSF